MVLENYAVIHGVLEEYGAWFKGFDDLHPPDLIDPEDEAEYDRVSKEIEEDERARKAAKACQLLKGTVKEDRRSTAYDRPDPTEINNSSSKSPLSNAAKNESRVNVTPAPVSAQCPDRLRNLYDGFVSANENEYSDVEPPSMTRSAPIKASFLDLHSNLVAVPPPATSPASVANPPHVARPTSVCPVITAKPVLHNAKTHCAQANCPEGVCIEDPQYEAKLEDSSRQARFSKSSFVHSSNCKFLFLSLFIFSRFYLSPPFLFELSIVHSSHSLAPVLATSILPWSLDECMQ